MCQAFKKWFSVELHDNTTINMIYRELQSIEFLLWLLIINRSCYIVKIDLTSIDIWCLFVKTTL